MQITIKDFCILLVSTMKLRGISFFDVNHISEELGVFSNDLQTKILFDHLTIGEDNKIIGMKEYIWTMLLSGYEYFAPAGPKWAIKVDETTAEQIVNRYPIQYQIAMNVLVSEYKIEPKVNKKIQ